MMQWRLAMTAAMCGIFAVGCSSDDKAEAPETQQSARPFAVQDNEETRRVSDLPGQAANDGPVFALLPDGLVVTHGSAKGQAVTLLKFGDAQDKTIDALSRDLGQPLESDKSNCSDGALHFADFGELRASFSDGKFVGWRTERGKGLPTGEGIGPDTSFHSLEKIGAQMVRDADADGEFVLAGSPFGKGMGGILSPDERVSSLHAGENCL